MEFGLLKYQLEHYPKQIYLILILNIKKNQEISQMIAKLHYRYSG